MSAQVAADLQPITRPDGRTYRPRKAPTAILTGYDGETEGVIVLRTHDGALARKIAGEALHEHEPAPDGWTWQLSNMSKSWGHWRPTGSEGDRTWQDDPSGKTGTPAVWFSADQV